MANLITLIAITRVKRTYPHVETIPEWQAKQSIRLLWDRVWGFEERLQALEANVKQITTAVNTLNTNLAGVKQLAQQAYALAQVPATSPLPVPEPPGSEGNCPDDGEAGNGVSTARNDPGAYPNGDIVVPHDAFSAGLIIGGTANEFPLLTAPAIDGPTREGQNEELLRRMIWHLNQDGFVAGRQRNPSSAISKDKLTVGIGGETFAYDVFQGVDFNQEVPVQAGRVCPADYVADPGISD
jgi:hypothetical protein